MNELSLESRVVSKVTWRLIPFLFICYVVNFLDRVNVGFAALSMNADLGFSSAVYGLGAGIFFIGYFVMEIPGNLIMHKVGARFWIARILITWGLISGAQAWVSTANEFYFVRFLLGVAEASFTPGIWYYLSHWFRTQDQAKATALFMTAMPLSSVIGAPISSHLLGLTWLGWAGWKWMFILEAVPSVIMGIVCIFYLTDKPHQAKWLNAEERNWLVDAMAKDVAAKEEKQKYTVWDALKNPQIILLCFIYFAWVTGFYGVTMFMPTLVKGLSSSISNMMVGWLVMVPYLAAFIAMVWVGRQSDKTGERRNFVIALMGLGGLGLALSVYFSGVNVVTSMFFYTITAAAIYGAFPAFWAIIPGFMTGAAAAVAFAYVNSIGNLGGFLGPYAMGYIRTMTGSFNTGVLFLAGCLWLAGILLMFLKVGRKQAQ